MVANPNDADTGDSPASAAHPHVTNEALGVAGVANENGQVRGSADGVPLSPFWDDSLSVSDLQHLQMMRKAAEAQAEGELFFENGQLLFRAPSDHSRPGLPCVFHTDEVGFLAVAEHLEDVHPLRFAWLPPFWSFRIFPTGISVQSVFLWTQAAAFASEFRRARSERPAPPHPVRQAIIEMAQGANWPEDLAAAVRSLLRALNMHHWPRLRLPSAHTPFALIDWLHDVAHELEGYQNYLDLIESPCEPIKTAPSDEEGAAQAPVPDQPLPAATGPAGEKNGEAPVEQDPAAAWWNAADCGPRDRGVFLWQGKAHHLTPDQWDLLALLWKREAFSEAAGVETEKTAQEHYTTGGREEPDGDLADAFRKLRDRTNNSFMKLSVPLEVDISRGRPGKPGKLWLHRNP